MSSDGTRRAFTVWMLDSAGKGADGNWYTTISRNKIDWMLRKNEKIKKDSGILPSLVFQHVPIPETVQLIRECEKIMNAQSMTGDFMSSTPKKPTALSANIRMYALKMSANLKR